MAKVWKKICLIILVLACLFNIVGKLVKKIPFLEELRASAQYMYEENKQNK